MGLLLLYLFSALGISFLCSILEAVLLSTPMSFVTMLEQEGKPGAALLKKYKQNIDKPIAAILSLNTIAHTVGAAGVGAQSETLFGSEFFALTSALLTLLILVVSEIIPKTIGAAYWRVLAMPSARITHALVFVTFPLVLMSEMITHLFAGKKQPVSVSREEVSAMVVVGTTEGIFRESESKIIKNCIRLASVKAREVMTPSIVVETANVNLTIKEFYEQQTWNFSRIPVYDKSKDYIIGYVLKDMVLKELSEDKFETRLSDLMRPILSFNEDDSVYQIWEKMLEKREHISIILDEYGCLRGVVSMEDVIETMTGVEIVDEDDVAVDMQAFAKEKSRKMSQR